MTSSWELSPLAQLAVIATGLAPLAPDAPAVLCGIWLTAVVTAWVVGLARDDVTDNDIGWPA